MRFFGCETMTSEQGKQMLLQHGFRADEEIRIGGYDLLLICHVPSKTYHLAVQRVERDFTDIDQQRDRFPAALASNPSDFYPAISYWIQRHGSLYMASHDERKNRAYPKVLRKIGFKVTQTSFFGHPIFEVTL